MNIAIYTKGERYLTERELDMWLELFGRHGIRAVFNRAFIEQTLIHSGMHVPVYDSAAELPADTRMVISYGGDGTFLQCVEMLSGRDIPIVGVNSGRMGFLANIPREMAERSVLALKEGDYGIEERGLLQVEEMEGNALNEFTVQKRSLSMIDAELFIDDEYVATYRADGLIVSTPTGSTAYSLSAGGAIVSPRCDVLIITPIAPHNLNMRPLIVEGNARVAVRAGSRNHEVLASLDNRSALFPEGTTFHIGKAPQRIKMVKFPDNSFYKTIREKLFWGADVRNASKR